MSLWTRKTSSKWLLSASVLLVISTQCFFPEQKTPGTTAQSAPVFTSTTQPVVSSLPLIPEATTISSTTPQTTDPSTSTSLSTPVTEPILCPRYSHPLHHLPCEEADARQTATTVGQKSAAPVVQAGGEELRACIAHYESTSGLDPNVYQFTQGTWEAYGGKGSPSNASYAEQTRVFWLAWNDAGHWHWLAQKGRCF